LEGEKESWGTRNNSSLKIMDMVGTGPINFKAQSELEKWCL
jgi:hypothetical protein